MKKYTRNITGVISNYSCCPYVDGKRIDEIVAEMVGKNCSFAGTVSIVITDLTADTGPVSTGADGPAPEPDVLPAPEQPAAAVPDPNAPAEPPAEGSDAK